MSHAHEFRFRGDRPRWGGTLARSLYTGIVVGMLSGFVALLVAIVSGMITAYVLHGEWPDLRFAYRVVAPAVAVFFAALGFAANLFWERTHPAPAATRTSA